VTKKRKKTKKTKKTKATTSGDAERRKPAGSDARAASVRRTERTRVPGSPAFLVVDAVGEEAERCRTSGPRAVAASRILGVQ
jgi:hypothetical protein